MTALIDHADVNTHVKIVAIALIAAIVVMVIGIHAHIGL